jgi:hypothetical protein
MVTIFANYITDMCWKISSILVKGMDVLEPNDFKCC